MSAARPAASPAAESVVHLASATALVPEEILATPRGGSRGMFRDLAALVLDRHLRRLVRIRQPVDLRLGLLLVRVDSCSGHLALGFARLSDYATERLGLPARRVQTLLALARRLAELPRLAAAFEAGIISLSQVRLLLRVATAANEAGWIERAGETTVRRLEIAVRAAVSEAGAAAPLEEGAANGGAAAADDDAAVDDDAPAGEFIAFDAPAAIHARWEQALEIARRSAGAGDPAWRSVEFIVADYLSGVPDLAALLARMSGARSGGERSAGDAAAADAFPARSAGDPPCPGGTPCPGESVDGTGIELFEEVLAGLEAEVTSRDPAIPSDGPVVVLPDSVQETAADTAVDLDARLRELVRIRQNISWNLGRLLRLFADRRLYRELGFMSLARFCRERLGLGVRRAWLLIGLERRLVMLPGIAHAYRSGALSWVRASTLARVASEVSEQRWLRLAAAVTVRRLLEEAALAEGGPSPRGPRGLDADGRVQLLTPTRGPAETSPATGPANGSASMAGHVAGAGLVAGAGHVAGAGQGSETGSRTRIRFWSPYEVASLWHEALEVCRYRAGRPLDDWECVASILASFLDTWGVRADPAWRRRYRIFERDGWRCRVPGCSSRRNLQVHHIDFRSHGGTDDDANLAVLCAAHHLQGIHRNRLRCHALPDGLLAWEFGPDPIRGPFARYVEDVEWSAARAAVAPAADALRG